MFIPDIIIQRNGATWKVRSDGCNIRNPAGAVPTIMLRAQLHLHADGRDGPALRDAEIAIALTGAEQIPAAQVAPQGTSAELHERLERFFDSYLRAWGTEALAGIYPQEPQP